jgi:hypothetical protein
MNSNEVMAVMNYTVGDNFGISGIGGSSSYPYIGDPVPDTCWHYWQNWYYPTIIRESYPIYIQERAVDKGKKAFEIIKILKDKKLIHIQRVSDFIDIMDELIKIL